MPRTHEEPAEWFYDDPAGEYTLNVTDDGNVGWAYLMTSREIIGDVWLYNVGDTPDEAPWLAPDAREKMPFKNPRQYYAGTTPFEPISDEGEELSIAWRTDQSVRLAEIAIRGALHAVLREGDKPGCCVLADEDGPCARKLSEYQTNFPSAT